MTSPQNIRVQTFLILIVLLALAGGLASQPVVARPTNSLVLAGGLPQQAYQTYSEYGEKIAAARAVVL